MLTGQTKRLAVLGHPVGHSKSPAMQNAALREAGLNDWEYEAIDVPPEYFDRVVRELPARGFVGVNVTVPHKARALAVADDASDAARRIGAANTLTFDRGEIHADNTDAPGLIDLLEPMPGAGLPGRKALVLGAGGAGRAAVWALVEAGADVSLWNRTRERADELAAELGGKAITADEAAAGKIDPGEFDLILNASAAGLGSGDGLAELPLEPDGFRAGQTVVDMVYGEGPGTLLEAAERAGATLVDGLDVLVAQGARSFQIWTGMAAPIEVMSRAVRP